MDNHRKSGVIQIWIKWKMNMAEQYGHFREVLDGYAKLLQDKNLAMDKHRPYLVRWVREFLLFARARAGYSFEQTLDLFLAEVGGRVASLRNELGRRVALIDFQLGVAWLACKP